MTLYIHHRTHSTYSSCCLSSIRRLALHAPFFACCLFVYTLTNCKNIVLLEVLKRQSRTRLLRCMYIRSNESGLLLYNSTVGIHYIVTVTALTGTCLSRTNVTLYYRCAFSPTVFLPFIMTLAAETRAAYRSVLREFARSVRAESPSSKHWSLIKFIFAVNSSSWQEE